MSCCCPPAIAAIFCLWVRNGFSKACVAGALTFFPPDPALYKFVRVSKEGEILEDDGLSDDDQEEDFSDEDEYKNDTNNSVSGNSVQCANGTLANTRPRRRQRRRSGHHPDEEDEPKSAMSALTSRQKQLERLAKKKLRRDQADVANGVTYQFAVDDSLCPARFAPYLARMLALKLYNRKCKSHIAVVVYRVPKDGETAPDSGNSCNIARSATSSDCSHESQQQAKPVKSASVDASTDAKVKASSCPKTIIYSHGNATDIGGMSLMQCYLARGLEVNVVMYDYSGYGESGGTPLEDNTYSDIETVYKYVLEELAENDPNNIIVYGQSVGSGPSCYICSRKPAGGLILHSPFMSGIRVLTPSRALAPLDIFPNIDRIKRVNCPVMIIHGMLDEEVDQSHGVALHHAVKKDCKRDPWWVPDRGHNDICEGSRHMNEYMQRLKVFLSSLDE